MMQLFRANVDLYETEDEVVAKFDLPGASPNEIDVSVDDRSLIVRVEKSEGIEERRENAFVLERSYSGFFRSIPLPDEADVEKADAIYENGVLTVRFPIREGFFAAGRSTEGAGGTGGKGANIPVSIQTPSGGMTTGRGWPGSPAPYQQRMSREEMMRQGSDSPMYRAGSGTYYSDTFERPTGRAAPESSFGEGSPERRAAEVSRREADVAKREAEVARREMAATKSVGIASSATGIGVRESSAPYQQRMSGEEMMRQGTDSPIYRAGSGSYYSETFEKPTGDVAPQSSFGSGTEGGGRRRGGRGKSSRSK